MGHLFAGQEFHPPSDLQRPGYYIARFNYSIKTPIRLCSVFADLFRFRSIGKILLRFFNVLIKTWMRKFLIGNNLCFDSRKNSEISFAIWIAPDRGCSSKSFAICGLQLKKKEQSKQEKINQKELIALSRFIRFLLCHCVDFSRFIHGRHFTWSIQLVDKFFPVFYQIRF